MLACWSLARFTIGRMSSSLRASEILYQCVCDLLLTESFLSDHWPCAQARHDVVYITVINFRDTASYHTVITSKNSANCSGGPVDSVAQKPPLKQSI